MTTGQAAYPSDAALPRRNALLYTGLLLPLSVSAVVAPFLLLGSGDARFAPLGLWGHFKDGGIFMWFITFAQMLFAVVLTILGALMVRGKRIPAALLFILSLGPFAIGLAGALVAHRVVLGAIEGDTIDASQKARIFAAGLSEVANLGVYGGVASAFLMFMTASIGAMSVASVDPLPLGPPPRSYVWIASTVLALAAAAGGVFLRIKLGVPILVLDLLIVAGLLAAGLFAAAPGRRLPALIAGRNDAESGPAFRFAWLTAFALAAASLFAHRAALAAGIRGPIGAISAENVTAGQRLTILRAMVGPVIRGRPILMLAEAGACVLVFLCAIIAGRAAKKKVSIGGVLAFLAAAATAAFAVLAERRVDADTRTATDTAAPARQSVATNGVNLPVVNTPARPEPAAAAPAILMKADGSLADDRAAAGLSEKARIDVAADGSVSFEAFLAKAGAAVLTNGNTRSIGLLASFGGRGDPAELGPYAALLGPDVLVYPVTLNASLEAGFPARPRESTALAVLPSGETARLVLVSAAWPGRSALSVLAEPFSFAETEVDARHRTFRKVVDAHPLEAILLAPEPAETMTRVASMIDAVRDALDGSQLDIILTGDKAALEKAAAVASDAEAAAGRHVLKKVSVKGALPPEVVHRVFHQSNEAFLACYTAAKKPGAEPPRDATVTFTIESNGRVSRAFATAERLSPITACVQRTTLTLAFVPPEKGSVTVIATLAF